MVCDVLPQQLAQPDQPDTRCAEATADGGAGIERHVSEAGRCGVSHRQQAMAAHAAPVAACRRRPGADSVSWRTGGRADAARCARRSRARSRCSSSRLATFAQASSAWHAGPHASSTDARGEERLAQRADAPKAGVSRGCSTVSDFIRTSPRARGIDLAPPPTPEVPACAAGVSAAGRTGGVHSSRHQSAARGEVLNDGGMTPTTEVGAAERQRAPMIKQRAAPPRGKSEITTGEPPPARPPPR
jgi:hypothetical protein